MEAEKPIKALSIKQPWAYLIACGIKNIENRTWKTNFRGRIYIHASGKTDQIPYQIFTVEQFEEIEKRRYDLDVLVSYKNTGMIIGEVDIMDCVINHNSIWAETTATTQDGRELVEKPIYNWVLANPVLYDNPILNVKGKLSLWDFKKEEI